MPQPLVAALNKATDTNFERDKTQVLQLITEQWVPFFIAVKIKFMFLFHTSLTKLSLETFFIAFYFRLSRCYRRAATII